jgi:hypothetical protein
MVVTRLVLLNMRQVDPAGFTVDGTVIAPSLQLVRHTLADDDVDREQQWHNLFDSVRAIKRYVDEHEADFLLTVYPWGHQVSDSEWLEGRRRFVPPKALVSDASVDRIADFAASEGLSFISMFKAFREYGGAERLYFSFDMHWTPAGHQLAADELQPAIERAIMRRWRPEGR